jgi:hypothetical protein
MSQNEEKKQNKKISSDGKKEQKRIEETEN